MALCGLIAPDSVYVDKVVFTGSFRGSFSKEAWKLVRIRGTKLTWLRLMCFKPNVPTYGFISWLAISNRFHTWDMIKIWCEIDGTSVLCRQHQ